MLSSDSAQRLTQGAAHCSAASSKHAQQANLLRVLLRMIRTAIWMPAFGFHFCRASGKHRQQANLLLDSTLGLSLLGFALLLGSLLAVLVLLGLLCGLLFCPLTLALLSAALQSNPAWQHMIVCQTPVNMSAYVRQGRQP